MDDDMHMAHEAQLHAIEREDLLADEDDTTHPIRISTSTYRYVCGYGWVADTHHPWTQIDFTVMDPRK